MKTSFTDLPDSLTTASDALEKKLLSSSELLEINITRIEETDGKVNSFVTRMFETAREDALSSTERALKGSRLSPLDGIPIAVKDIYDTEGVVTSRGSAAYKDHIPSKDATTVKLLRDSGAVIIGKTNTHEVALGGTTNNVNHGATRNPWNLAHVPGGSSGGSASALAARQCLGALGSDTGGSIRIPAAFCSVTGHKPTYGLVSRAGVFPVSYLLDHAGPMAISAEDCALMLNALAKYDPEDRDSINVESKNYRAELNNEIKGLRFVVIPSFLEGCETEVLENFHLSLEVMKNLGVAIEYFEPIENINEIREKIACLISAESGTYNLIALEKDLISEPGRTRMLGGLSTPVEKYIEAIQLRKEIQALYEKGLENFDAYVTPTTPMTAEAIEKDPTQEQHITNKFKNTQIFDFSHQPSISVPNGLSASGLPTGLMISTKLFSDSLTLRIGHAYQQVTSHHLQSPEI
ncbi:MAG: hypothetical protein CL792_00855 [Chloroflexi bacterium]|nr:hypothetical protein [Chloroflexota bacterium]|tara:strand:+ start:450 stop:1844 length:1395 start_codon:yes stop_codon:yes gene_type:complete